MINTATELMQEGNLLRQNNENYKSFFNAVEDFLLVLNCQGNILLANSSVIERLGYTQEELYGNSVLMLHPSDRREEAALLINEMLSGRKLFCPIPVITKSGIQIAVETRITLGMWDGQPAIFGVSKDISKLRIAEENFLKSLYINPSACGLSDLDDFKYTEVNDAFYALFGFTKEEVIGRTAMDLGIMTPKARELILQKSGPDGNVVHVETDLKTKNGEILHVLLTSSTVLLQDKKYRFTVVNDITARVKAEEMLRNTKIRLHTLVQSIPDLIWVKDAKGVYLSCNTMFERFFGARESDIIGKTDYDFVSSEVADLFRENDFKAMRAGKPTTNEEWVKFSDDGHRAFFETIKAPMHDSNGTLIGVLGIGRDITERNTAALALSESEEKFKRIFEGSNDGIILMNKKGVLDCNSRTLEIFKFESKEQLLGLNPSRLYPAFQPDGEYSTTAAAKKITIALKQGTNNFDWVFRRANGEDFPVKVRLSNFKLAGKTILQCTIRDISSTEHDLIIANKELVFQNQEKENRAAELIIANVELDFQNQEKEKRAAELIIANKELVFQNLEKEKRASELILANKELVFQLEEKEKRAAELIIANKELAFQNEEKKKRADELIVADKELAFQNEEKENRASELIIANEELVFQSQEKEKRAAELIIANKELVFQNEEKKKRADELLVADKELAFQNEEKENRAAELLVANIELDFQNEEKENRASELIIANKELVFQNEEKEKRAAELIIANKELIFQNQEKEKRASELIVANEELVFQSQEKEKRAAELNIANKELVFQNQEKENRASELVLANKELVFQNQEKENRAAELNTANLELIFQLEEKEKRAAELIIANEELAFQNEEKKKRADELLVADKELAFQNEEKENRAAELIIANKELVFQNLEKEKRASELVIADMELDYQNEEKEKREAANKELEAFSYSVSHDLRAPLRHIGGFVDLLVKNNASQLDVTGLRYLNIISDSSREMGNLIDALLSFSRLSRAELQRTKINSKMLIDKVIRNFGDELEGRNIDIQRLELPDLKGDENLITQVWINLISNALKYSRNKEKTIIEIGGKIENDKTTFYIKDNGAGFDMKYADKLFGVFQRLHKARDFEGIGIGLANVNRIIIKHGGKCWAEGEVGVGATFFFNVPNN
ncbi:MAG: PAS domain S-box protein [Mariniphaga sp.]